MYQNVSNKASKIAQILKLYLFSIRVVKIKDKIHLVNFK